jgi:DnaJ-class molecular chaperone
MIVPPVTDEDTPLDFFVFLAILAGVMGIYYVSLRLNPWVECSKCHGQPRPRGVFFGYSHHLCSKCQGTGHQLRFGRRLFGMGPP